MNVGIVLAGGVGRRFGGNVPKQYQTINKKEVIYYSINALTSSSSIDKIIVVAQNQYANGIKEINPNVEIVEGGDTRNNRSTTLCVS